MLLLFTSMYSQLSVAKAMVSRATAMMEQIVAKLKVTAEQGIFDGTTISLSVSAQFGDSNARLGGKHQRIINSRHSIVISAQNHSIFATAAHPTKRKVNNGKALSLSGSSAQH